MRNLSFILLAIAALSLPARAQVAAGFDPVAAGAELETLDRQLDEQVTRDEIDPAWLSTTRARVIAIQTQAERCESAANAERDRLDARFAPLENVTGDVAPAVMDERTEIIRLRNEVITRQTQCASVAAAGDALATRVTGIQTTRSQQYLSNRGDTIIVGLRDLPDEIREWPQRLRGTVEIRLVDDVTPISLLWMLVGSGLVAAALGLAIHRRFTTWFEAGGGRDAPPQMKYLFPKPLAEYSPLLLEGLALLAVLMLAVENASFELAALRIAGGIFLFGVGCVIIDWSTGPLSPSASVKGLIPDHVPALRFRLRLFLFTLVLSFIVLGTRWLAIRTVDPDVSGRATMIFLVAIALLYLLAYLRHIPGVRGRFRLIRYLGSLSLVVGIVALLFGYQNLAGYLVHGVTRTLIAIMLLWILLWLVYTGFSYLISAETRAASQIRAGLGVSKKTSRSGLGLLQLIADIIIWVGFIVYLIYVWDESGTTLERLVELVVRGGSVGSIRLIPIDIIGGILVFAVLLVVIGWIKRWIESRWLQQIGIERGGREALVTLIGYVGFVIAVLIALAQANVDLTGIAFVGAALGLGIGFGMQEIASNFVSGLILLFERPIRTGDFVTVGEVEGFVRSIRIRATEIETLDNQNVLVPNSELVSGHVTNWVLRDTQGRLRVRVGVAYGSDIERVRDILESIANEHPEVITDGTAPGPRALFMEFGDSSLNFELRVRIRRIDRRFTVQSDLNFAIDRAFREAGITVPFPQRDLHLVSLPGTDEADESTAPPASPVDTAEERVGVGPDSVTRSHRDEAEIHATIEEVWDAVTDLERVQHWLPDMTELQPRIGGAWSLTSTEGTDAQGRIDIFVPPRRLRMVVAPREGEEPLPTGPITLDYLLYSRGDKTVIVATVAGIPATEDWEYDFNVSERRWRTAMTELQEYLAGD